MPRFTINGRDMDVPAGTTVLEAAKQAGIEIPHYCYHPRLSVAGSCRMCLVEIEKFPKLQTACSTAVTEGMVVRTDTEKVRRAVRGVLELMLIHHPVDCPICDQAGECGLQNYYMKYGLHRSRYALEDKVRKTKAHDVGGLIVLDSERCILCSRCVRFLREVTGTGELEIVNRGDRSEIAIFPGRPLDNFYTGNLADICPVGALTNKDFRFRCRVWFLAGADSICPGCATGCNVTIDSRDGVVYRLRPRQNDAVNQAWMCDFGRVAYKEVNDGRLLAPVLREGGRSVAAAWDAALYATALRLRQAVETSGPESVAVLASPRLSNEELYLVRRLAAEALGTPNLAFSSRTPGEAVSDDFLIRPDKNPNTKGALLLGLSEERFAAIVDRIAAKAIRAILIFGNGLADLPDEETGALLADVPFIAQVGTSDGTLARMAHAVLPQASFAERGGTYTNAAGRVQRFRAAFPPRGRTRTPIAILTGLADRLGAGWTFPDEEAVFEALAATEAPFADMSYDSIGTLGRPVADGVAVAGGN